MTSPEKLGTVLTVWLQLSGCLDLEIDCRCSAVTAKLTYLISE